MRDLHCTPNKAHEMLSKAGIRINSDLGRKLQNVIEQAEGPEDEQVVQLTEREEAQMHLPFLLSRMKDLPQDQIQKLFQSEEQFNTIQNWPEEPLNDEDYNDLVDAIQDFKDELVAFMLLDDEEATEVVDKAVEDHL